MAEKTLCIFCGSRVHDIDAYTPACQLLVREAAHYNMTVVYGGGNSGLMKVVADTMLACGGRIIGVIEKEFYDTGFAHDGLTQLQVVASVHERKTRMCELADAFVVLPGGVGTMDEFFEVIAMRQLKQHNKPCALLNAQQYYADLISFLEHMCNKGFVKEKHRDAIIIGDDPVSLMQRLLGGHEP